LELQEIAPRVFACLVEDRGWCWSNAGFVDRGPGLMVDTFADVARTRRALSLLADKGGDEPGQLVNTHHNLDHCWGNQLFRDREIIGHRRCAELMQRDLRPEMMQAMLDAVDPPPGVAWFAGDVRGEFDFSDVEITPPNRLLDGDESLELDGLRVELLYVGPAHTAGDLLVHLPDEGILFAGDVIFRGCTPIGWEGTHAGWLAALDRILALEPRLVVPGHGPLCGPEGARELRDYFEHVFAESRRCFEQELPVEEAARSIELGPFADWNQPERLVFNVARAYRELRGDAPDAALPTLELMDQAVALRPHLRG
jgi:glyoxylase-like metal-dependent hydrolase (beta-lactamase superfamily II)